ncbi:MAG TPA: NUDIX domain-containing protein [Spirochaetota bacterium]|nr:NUDIX domain-containing protein [Spirochaetota bacterium]HPR47772.1 NUDIX domain-containing protein [Spirochaetota bacterium]
MSIQVQNVPFVFCPACSKKQITYCDDGSVVCNNCGFHYYFNAASAVAAFIMNDGCLLMTERGRDPKKGMLDLPGGFVNAGETAENALRREIREELGIDLGNLRYFTSYPNTYTYKGVTYATLDLGFECTALDLNRLTPGDDVESCFFIPIKDIIYENIAFDSIRSMVRAYADSFNEQ